jgi:hypothetical protein
VGIYLEKPPEELLKHIEEHVAKFDDPGFGGIRMPNALEPHK